MTEFKRGDNVVVQRVNPLNPMAKRLSDMGFIRGACLEIVKPGNTCIVQLCGARLGLSKKNQDSIECCLQCNFQCNECPMVKSGITADSESAVEGSNPSGAVTTS